MSVMSYDRDNVDYDDESDHNDDDDNDDDNDEERAGYALVVGCAGQKMTGGTPEVRSDKNLTLLTFNI